MAIETRVTEDIQAAIVGMVLGDASIIAKPSNSGAAYLQYRHSLAQKDFALWKADILRQITHVSVTESDGYLDNRTGKKYPFINVKTRCHPLFSRLRQAFYPIQHKVVDPFWLKKLDERGFAIWYFDDGTYKGYNCYLGTLAFSWPENHVMAKFIWERFGIHVDVRPWGKGKPMLAFPAKSNQSLRDLLAPYAEPAKLMSKLPDVRPLRGANLRFAKTGKPRGWFPKGDDIVRSPQ
jgi:hypothetical protein